MINKKHFYFFCCVSTFLICILRLAGEVKPPLIVLYGIIACIYFFDIAKSHWHTKRGVSYLFIVFIILSMVLLSLILIP